MMCSCMPPRIEPSNMQSQAIVWTMTSIMRSKTQRNIGTTPPTFGSIDDQPMKIMVGISLSRLVEMLSSVTRTDQSQKYPSPKNISLTNGSYISDKTICHSILKSFCEKQFVDTNLSRQISRLNRWSFHVGALFLRRVSPYELFKTDHTIMCLTEIPKSNDGKWVSRNSKTNDCF